MCTGKRIRTHERREECQKAHTILARRGPRLTPPDSGLRPPVGLGPIEDGTGMEPRLPVSGLPGQVETGGPTQPVTSPIHRHNHTTPLIKIKRVLLQRIGEP